ncbi:Chitin synthase, class 1 [Nowakowskiella sp. JEL0078]|nr:Chitin synthase, class 1 [Nowakowskiella sp. JEL0078]
MGGGESKAEALPKVAAIKQKDGSITADVAVAVNKEELSSQYRSLVAELQTGLPGSKDNDKTTKKVDPQQKQEDDYKSFRTWLVLSYLASNAIIYGVATLTSKEVYLYILLYSIAGLTCVKMLGVIFFIVFRLFTDVFGWGNQGRALYRKQFGGSGGGGKRKKGEDEEEKFLKKKDGYDSNRQMSAVRFEEPSVPQYQQYQSHQFLGAPPPLSDRDHRASFVSVADTMAMGYE